MNKRTDWREDAACRDEDPELFFPISESGPGAEQVARAKRVCGNCPVRSECLNNAIDNALDHGIFGGTTPTERRKLARRTEQAPRAA